jgi:hypothetical protein
MNITWKTIIWHQFGAAIDTLDDVLRACPEDLWRARLWDDPSERPAYSQVWYRFYHTLFWLDLYLTGAEEGFVPPAPFALIEMAEDDLPERPYTKDELQAYLDYGRRKCQATIEALPIWMGRGQFRRVTTLQHAPRSGTCGPGEPDARAERQPGSGLCYY